MRRRELTQEGTLESDGRGWVQAPATAAPPPRARGEQDGRSSCSSRWEGRTTDDRNQPDAPGRHPRASEQAWRGWREERLAPGPGRTVSR